MNDSTWISLDEIFLREELEARAEEDRHLDRFELDHLDDLPMVEMETIVAGMDHFGGSPSWTAHPDMEIVK